MNKEQREVWQIRFKNVDIIILHNQFSGGGSCYEYKIIADYMAIIDTRPSIESNNEYGTIAAAVAGAFTYINDNETT